MVLNFFLWNHTTLLDDETSDASTEMMDVAVYSKVMIFSPTEKALQAWRHPGSNTSHDLWSVCTEPTVDTNDSLNCTYADEMILSLFQELFGFVSHLGFLPSLDHIDKSAFEVSGPLSNECQKKLQLYHDFLAVLLQEVKNAATNKPVMMINLGGVMQKRRLHNHVSVVMGNQKSQDYLCGRKSINSGNAGRVHCSCMTSGLQVSNMVAGCCLANPDVISHLNEIAMMELNECVPGPAKTFCDTLSRMTTLEKCEYKKALAFLNRRVKLARSIQTGMNKNLLEWKGNT
jgi:hypothetical protein